MNFSALLLQPQPSQTCPAPRTGPERGLQAAESGLRRGWDGWPAPFARFCGVNAALRGVGLGLLLLAAFACPPVVCAQSPTGLSPLDNWAFMQPRAANSQVTVMGLTNGFLPGNFQCVAVGPDGNIYLGTNITIQANGTPTAMAVSVWSSRGQFLRRFGTFSNLHGMVLDSQTNLYVLDIAGPTLSVFTSNGTLIRSHSGLGTGDFQFGSYNPNTARYSTIAVDQQDRVILADAGNNRIMVFAPLLQSLVTKWGTLGYGYGQLASPVAVLALPQGIFVGDYADSTGNRVRAQLFDTFGGVLKENREFYWSIHSGATLDGLVVAPEQSGAYQGAIALAYFYRGVDSLGGSRSFHLPISHYDASTLAIRHRGLVFDRAGTLYLATTWVTANVPANQVGLYVSPRKYATDLPLAATGIPAPNILASKQRTNTTFVDLDFTVADGDSPTVQVGVLAFTGTGQTLDSVVQMNALVEGTATNRGPNVPANTVRRITWDASEYATNFLNLQFEVLAKDERPMLGFTFVTLPPVAGQPDLTISTKEVTESELFTMWLWLIASGDTNVVFTNAFAETYQAMLQDGRVFPSLFPYDGSGNIYRMTSGTNGSSVHYVGYLYGSNNFNTAFNTAFLTRSSFTNTAILEGVGAGFQTDVRFSYAPTVLPGKAVNGIVGAYAGQPLASSDATSGSLTTTLGRAFLYERLRIRAATAAEVTRAQQGNYGITVGVNSVVKLP